MHTIHTAPSAKRMPMRHGHAACGTGGPEAERRSGGERVVAAVGVPRDNRHDVARARYKVLSSGTPPGPKIRRDMMLQGEGLALGIKF